MPMSSSLSKSTTTLSALLIGVTLAAVGLWAAREWIPIPGQISTSGRSDDELYESAQASHALKVRLGPNRFAVVAVARNGRGGGIEFSDGQGNALSSPGYRLHESTRTQAGWLDVAEVFMNHDADLLDVIELRVFDHKTRKLLSNGSRTGSRYDLIRQYDQAEHGVVRVWGLGQRLPDSIDIWFRAASYTKDESLVRLDAVNGASVPFETGRLTVREVHPGGDSYRVQGRPGSNHPRYLWTTSTGDDDTSCAVILEWDGEPLAGRYRIRAVCRDGQSVFPTIQHILEFSLREVSQAIQFETAAAQIDHFELRPFEERHTFYFDDVRLPTPTHRPFREPPVAALRVDGREVDTQFGDFDPIEVRLKLREKNPMTTEPDNLGRPACTAILEVEGIQEEGWEITFFDRDETPFDPRKGGYQSMQSGHLRFRETSTYRFPIDRIGSVEIRPPQVD